eukprot:TRINITY_DN84294_c0_g1_i1.p2 TRINITY_DN84294_c0_g1~~TRINITY_DN84294_c0_g1_i1.p2  ORF type:complete len:143 (+),score=14.21 TRINITY_DN84294_c0_g1_i1:369-797(+)
MCTASAKTKLAVLDEFAACRVEGSARTSLRASPADFSLPVNATAQRDAPLLDSATTCAGPVIIVVVQNAGSGPSTSTNPECVAFQKVQVLLRNTPSGASKRGERSASTWTAHAPEEIESNQNWAEGTEPPKTTTASPLTAAA